MPVRHVVAIGASAGGVEAVSRVVAGLPTGFPAAVLITIHTARESRSVLPAVLDRAGSLPAVPARDGEQLVAGRIYVAVPDFHLVVRDAAVWNVCGPREHHSRPAVDPMLRSAAAAFGPSVIGVILSGALDDGTAGLIAVKRAGGVAVAQDPDEARHRGMPASAVANVECDAVLHLEAIAPYLVAAVGGPTGARGGGAVDDEGVTRPVAEHPHPPEGSTPSPYACPDCGGVLWEVADNGFVRYRCRVGHAFTVETLHDLQGESIEHALWAALRALEERAALSRRMAESAHGRGHSHTATRFAEAAAEAARHARVVNRLLLGASHEDRAAERTVD